MIVAPELCDAKINSCSKVGLQDKIDFNQLISENELEVAIETEVVADDDEFIDHNNNDNNDVDKNCFIDLEQSFNFDKSQSQGQQQLPQQCNVVAKQPDTDKKLDDFFLKEFNFFDSRLADSVSTISIDDPSFLEDDALNFIDESLNMDISLEGEANLDICNFCDDILNQTATLESQITTSPLYFVNQARVENMMIDCPDLIKANDSQSSSFESGQTFRYSADTDLSCRKSARIAEKRQSKSRRTSGNLTDDSDSNSDGKAVGEIETIGRRSSKTRSLTFRSNDEEFILRRTRSVSKSRRKRGRVISKEDGTDYLKAHKQEKNRLAARRCRMKQKVLTDKLTAEVQDLENDEKNFNEEIFNLKNELSQLQRFVNHHDNLVRVNPTLHRCPLRGTDLLDTILTSD